MTFQARKVLRAIRSCQPFLGCLVYYDENEKRFMSMQDDALAENAKVKTRSVRYSDPDLSSILRMLSDEGYITIVDQNYVSVTHSGNHRAQVLVYRTLCFLAKSVVVPILVSILTTIALHIIQGRL